MSNGALALLEVLLIFGGALGLALHQLYQLRAKRRRTDKADGVRPRAPDAPGAAPPPSD